MSESAQTRTKLREQEVILTKIKGMSEVWECPVCCSSLWG